MLYLEDNADQNSISGHPQTRAHPAENAGGGMPKRNPKKMELTISLLDKTYGF